MVKLLAGIILFGALAMLTVEFVLSVIDFFRRDRDEP